MSFMRRAILFLICFAISLGCVVLPLEAMTNDSATIVALVRSTTQLKIDNTVPAPSGWDKATHPYVRVVGAREDLSGGNIDPDFAALGIMSDGTQVMAVPLESGGSGGVFTQIVFVRSDPYSKPYFAGFIDSGGHLAVNVAYHSIVATSPHYGPKDANCCPSSYDIRTYVVAGKQLKLVSAKTAAKP